MDRVTMGTVAIPYDASADVVASAGEELGGLLAELSAESTAFRVRGRNVGWRNQSLDDVVVLEDGADLVRKFTPEDDWSLVATLYEDHLSIVISRRRSTDGENYIVRPA